MNPRERRLAKARRLRNRTSTFGWRHPTDRQRKAYEAGSDAFNPNRVKLSSPYRTNDTMGLNPWYDCGYEDACKEHRRTAM